jgi:hypothetical protein
MDRVQWLGFLTLLRAAKLYWQSGLMPSVVPRLERIWHGRFPFVDCSPAR